MNILYVMLKCNYTTCTSVISFKHSDIVTTWYVLNLIKNDYITVYILKQFL